MRKPGDAMLWLKEPCTLDGYTFYLACKFETRWGKISNVWLFFRLEAGDKDDFVEWPFAKQVTLSFVHPDKEEKDVEVPFKITSKTDAKCLARPRANVPQKGIYSDKIRWKDIEKNGLVCDDSILVKVDFE